MPPQQPWARWDGHEQARHLLTPGAGGQADIHPTHHAPKAQPLHLNSMTLTAGSARASFPKPPSAASPAPPPHLLQAGLVLSADGRLGFRPGRLRLLRQLAVHHQQAGVLLLQLLQRAEGGCADTRHTGWRHRLAHCVRQQAHRRCSQDACSCAGAASGRPGAPYRPPLQPCSPAPAPPLVARPTSMSLNSTRRCVVTSLALPPAKPPGTAPPATSGGRPDCRQARQQGGGLRAPTPVAPFQHVACCLSRHATAMLLPTLARSVLFNALVGKQAGARAPRPACALRAGQRRGAPAPPAPHAAAARSAGSGP